eukprot:g6405.t1
MQWSEQSNFNYLAVCFLLIFALLFYILDGDVSSWDTVLINAIKSVKAKTQQLFGPGTYEKELVKEEEAKHGTGKRGGRKGGKKGPDGAQTSMTLAPHPTSLASAASLGGTSTTQSQLILKPAVLKPASQLKLASPIVPLNWGDEEWKDEDEENNRFTYKPKFRSNMTMATDQVVSVSLLVFDIRMRADARWLLLPGVGFETVRVERRPNAASTVALLSGSRSTMVTTIKLLWSGPSYHGRKPGWITDLSHPMTMVSPKFLRLWQPKELLRGNLFRTPPPDQLDSRYAKKCLMVKANPARLLKLYELYAKKSDSVDSRFLVRVFCILAQTVAHPNCFFTTADRQRIVSGTAAGSSSANSSFGSGQSAAATSNNLVFRKLCSDIAELQAEIRGKEVPQILFSMALLEYRFWQIGERLLCSVEENLHVYRFETLATVIWAMAKLNLGGVRTGRSGTTAGAAATASMTTSEIEDRMDAGTGYFIYQTLYCLDVLKPEACPTAMGTKEYRDYVNAGAFTPKRIQLGLDSACFAEQKAELAKELSRECTTGAGKKRREQRGRRRKVESAETTEADREPEDEGEDESEPEGADPHSDADGAPAAEPDDNHPRHNESRRRQHMEDDENDRYTPEVGNCSSASPSSSKDNNEQKNNGQHDHHHDHEEQADLHDLPRRNIEIETKMACPMWIQERLHEFWLDGTLLKAQPQGADELQLDVERALNRTHTKASINTSLGRPHDEQHCFFAGHFLRPNIALEHDSHSCMGPDRVRAGGMVSLKQKLFAKFGVRTATIHRTFWDRLTADEKDEQVTRLRVAMGYRAMAKSGAPGEQGEDQQKEGRTGKWDCEYARKEGFGSAGFGRSRTGRKSGTTLGLAHVTVPDNDPNRAGAIKKTETERKVSIRGGKFREKRREKLT